VFLAALFDLFYAATNQDYLYCVIHILIGFVVSFFNKNMTVILTVTIASANIIRNLIRGTEMKVEGFDDADSQDPSNMMDSTNGNSSNKLFGTSATARTMGNTQSGNVSAATSSALISDLKDQAIDLQDAQKNIIQGFEKIEPYMEKAEFLIGEINSTAKTIQGMRTQEQGNN
jgi:hypothetical protein